MEIAEPQVPEFGCAQAGIDRHHEQGEQGGSLALSDLLKQLGFILARNRAAYVPAFALELHVAPLSQSVPKAVAFENWWRAYEHWKRTGEIIDPETGVVLESGNRLHKPATMAEFQRKVLSGRMLTTKESSGVDQLQPALGAPNVNPEYRSRELAAAHGELSNSGGVLDPGLAATIAMVQRTFPGARLVEVRNPQ